MEVGHDNVASEDYGNSKLYGLYRSIDDHIVFQDDDHASRAYHASTFAGIQKLLNLNESAFDPESNLLPSLGQNMASYNIITASIRRQSQINHRTSEPSMQSVMHTQNQAEESVAEQIDRHSPDLDG